MVPERWALGAGVLLGCNSISGLSSLEKIDCTKDCNSDGSAGAAGGGSLSYVALATGRKTSCVIMSDKTAWCWGANPGVAPGSAVTKPVKLGLTDVKSITLGADHACALKDSGEVLCWGRNDNGQLGDGTTDAHPEPTPVGNLPAIDTIAAAAHHTCAYTKPDDPTVQAFCWGKNNRGQLGNGTKNDSNEPIPVEFGDGAKIVRLSGGDEYTCALAELGDGTFEVRCWGRNDEGECAQDPASTPEVLIPTKIPVPAMERIYTGYHHVCARTALAKLTWCWGENADGQLGIGGTVTPYELPKPVVGDGAVPIDTMWPGYRHTCLLTSDDTNPLGVCWGANDLGQFGQTPSSGSTSPIKVPFLDKTVPQMRQSEHGCKIDDAKELYCWGSNDNGQVGNGKIENSTLPVRLDIPR